MLNMLQVRLESMQSQQQQWIAEVNKLAGRIQELSELMEQMRTLVAEDRIMIDLPCDIPEVSITPGDSETPEERLQRMTDNGIDAGLGSSENTLVDGAEHTPENGATPAYDNSIEPPV